jgi:hypothetical protein
MVQSGIKFDAAKIAKMLKDCDNFDPDVQSTGAFDLCAAVLKQQESFDENTENKIVQTWIKHLGDKSV